MFSEYHSCRLFLVCLIFCLTTAACSKPTVTVDALSASTGNASPEIRYAILPGTAEIRADDLRFVEYKGHLARVMRELGFIVTEDSAQATATVLLSYHARGIDVYADNSAPTVGIGIGSGSGGRRGISFFGLGIGVPIGNSQPDARYIHTVVLDAATRNPEGTGKNTRLWKAVLTTESNSETLRGIMPAMLESAKPYLGKDTRGVVTATLEGTPR